MSRLRLQLVILLVLVAILPSIPAILAARSLLQRSLNSSSHAALLDGVAAGLESARDLLDQEKELFRGRIRSGAPVDTLKERPPWEEGRDRARPALAAAPNPAAANPTIVRGPELLRIEGRSLLVAEVADDGQRLIWVARPLSPELETRSARLADANRVGQGLRRERDVLLRGLVLALLIVYGGALALVLLVGIHVGRRLTGPLESLAAGMERVSSGNLETRVAVPDNPALRTLIEQFNTMIGRLQTQQVSLLRLEKTSAWRDMARRLAHEIKNPLTPIQLATQELRESYRGPDDDYRDLLRESAAIISEEVEGLRRLVDEFSEFGRLPEPVMRPVALDSLLDGVRALHGPDRVSIQSIDLRVWCDPEEIHRVLVNLVKNALEAQERTSSREAVLIIGAAGPDGSTLMRVCDRGPGVPPAERSRIFEPNVSGRAGGMGLGLAIVEAIVQAHGGALGIEDREGGGAIFWFTLAVPPIDLPPTTEEE